MTDDKLYLLSLLMTGICGLIGIIYIVWTLPKGPTPLYSDEDGVDGGENGHMNNNALGVDMREQDIALGGSDGSGDEGVGAGGEQQVERAVAADFNVSRKQVLKMQKKRERQERRAYMEEANRQREEKREEALRAREERDWEYEEMEEKERRQREAGRRITGAWKAILAEAGREHGDGPSFCSSSSPSSSGEDVRRALIEALIRGGPVLSMRGIAASLGIPLVTCHYLLQSIYKRPYDVPLHHLHVDLATETVYFVEKKALQTLSDAASASAQSVHLSQMMDIISRPRSP